MLDTTTKKRIDDLRDILVGKLPNPSAQIEQITMALIYKFMEDMDRDAMELGGKAKFFSGDYEKYSWSNLFDSKTKGEQLVKLYSEAVESMEMNPNIPQLFRDIFKNAYLPYRDPETLREFLKIVNEFHYDHSEKLGDAFEYLLSVLGSQGDAGQFRTPRHIIDFMVEVIAPQKHETISDPACGTAGFLISTYKHILKTNSTGYTNGKADKPVNSEAEQVLDNPVRYKGDLLNPDDKAKVVKNIRGYDISPDMVRLSLVNLYLHGFPEPHIWEYDTLTSEERWNETFDVVLANPPFMSPKGGIKPHKRFSVQSKRSEVLFVDYIAEHLSIDGRAAIIVPEGVIFQSGTAYKQLRKMLVDDFLVGVISLPAGVFQPYSGVKTSILWLDKKLAKQTDKILFAKVENDGFDLGAQRKPIKKNDLPEILEQVRIYQKTLEIEEDTGKITLVDKKKIGESGDYNLSGERYKGAEIKNETYAYYKIGEIFKTSSGGTPSKSNPEYYINGTVPWLKSGEVAQGYIYKSEEFITEEALKKSSAKVFPVNTVLVAMYGATAGQVGVLKFEASTNQAVCGVFPNEKILPEFLFYLLKGKKDYLIKLSSGGAQPNISQTIIKDLEIPLPPLSIQQEIVEEIESYQKIIDGARLVVENYKPRIDIDPDWPMVELGKVCDKITDGSHYSPETSDEGFPYITVKDLNNGIIDFIGCKRINTESYQELARNGCKPEKNDVLFSKDGTVGKTAYIDYEREFVVLSSLAIIRPDLNQVLPEYLYKILSTDYFIKKAIDNKTGVAIRRIVLKTLKTILIPLPDLERQKEIAEILNNEKKLIDNNEQLIKIYEQKIKDRIAKVWGEEPKKEYRLPEDELRMVAEE